MLFDLIKPDRPFALIEKEGRVTCYQGAIHKIKNLDDIHKLARSSNHDIVFTLPYRAIQERGFEARGDEPILAMEAEIAIELPKEILINHLPDSSIVLDGEIKASQSDGEYAELVRNFQKNEIERGNASQTTLARSFTGKIEAFDINTALGSGLI